MKKLLFSLVLLLVGSYIMAQQSLTLSGTITNPAGKTVMLLLPNPLLPALKGQTKVDSLDEKGSFAMEISIARPVFATFRHGREMATIYLEPGKDVSLSLDMEQFDESLQYLGEGAAANNFMAAYFLKFEDTNPLQQQMKELEPVAFQAAATARREEREAFLQAEKKKLPAHFIKQMGYRIAYEWGNELLSYPSAHAYFNQTQEPELPADFLAYEKVLSLQEPEAMGVAVYQGYLFRKLRSRYNQEALELENIPEGAAYISGLYDFAEKQLKGEVLEYFRHKLLFEGMSYDGLDSYVDAYQRFVATTTVAEYKESLEAVYKQNERLMAGKPAPNFKLPTLEGKELSLEDLKGKVIYVDFWGSWCRPCLGEMPAAKKMKEHFKDQPGVAFVYISIDDNEDNWREMIEKQEIKGIHLYSKGWESQAPKAYLVRGIPRYVLIDREGKLIDANMSRPSSPATIKRIEEALASTK